MKTLLLILTGVVLSSCGEPSAPDGCNPAPLFGNESCGNPRVSEGCQTQVEVRISDDLGPRIDWSPPCGINHVVVRASGSDGQGSQIFWAFTSENELVGPGVRYGILPPGSISEGPTRALQPGTAYRVTVEMIVDGNVITGQGAGTFVR